MDLECIAFSRNMFQVTVNFSFFQTVSRILMAEKLPMHVKAGFPKTHGNEICVTDQEPSAFLLYGCRLNLKHINP